MGDSASVFKTIDWGSGQGDGGTDARAGLDFLDRLTTFGGWFLAVLIGREFWAARAFAWGFGVGLVRREVLIPFIGKVGVIGVRVVEVGVGVVEVGKVWVMVIRPGYISGVCAGVVDHGHFGSGEFHQELAWAAHAAVSEASTRRGAQLEVSFRTGDTDKEQASFFFELGRIVFASDVRQDILFDGGEEHVIEFQTFGRVEGHERDAILVGDVVGIACQADLFEELLQSASLA